MNQQIKDAIEQEVSLISACYEDMPYNRVALLRGAEIALSLMPDMFESLAFAHVDFTFKTFPETTAISSILKCRGELLETKEELELGNPADEGARLALAEEYADCFLCLIDSYARASLRTDEILEAIGKKIAKNKSRTWVKNVDNTYPHVKNAQPNIHDETKALMASQNL